MTNGPYYDPYHPYGDFPAEPTGGRSGGERQRRQWIAVGVAVLGLGAFAISFGSPVLIEWPVWFSTAAGAVAVLGMVPGQVERDWLVASSAVLGFVAAVSRLIVDDDSGWALDAVVTLNALQAIVAIAAVWLVAASTDPEGDGDEYRAYAEYVQAYQAYAMQQYQQSGQQVPSGQATAQAFGTAEAQGDSAATERAPYEEVQARYAGYGEQSTVRPAVRPGPPVAPAFGNPGLPRMGQGAPGARPQERTPESAQEHPAN